MQYIDLRSDTVTKPNTKMRIEMYNAVVGDDVFGDDPTVKLLEKRVADMFHKESALFFPSGTMSNLSAILTWCSSRGSEIIVGDKSHILLFEQTGASQFGGVSLRSVPNLDDGTMDIEQIKNTIRDDDIHEPVTKLICIENTHNVCGGKVLPLRFMKDLKEMADSYHIPVHMDGARIWNACNAVDIKPYEIAQYADSLSVCLSKGLGAPVGSLLVGSKDFITKAKRIRKALGGGMRQSGILASAGLVALDDFESGILHQDHLYAKMILSSIENHNLFEINKVDTNIIFINIRLNNKMKNDTNIASKIVVMFKERGILISAWSPVLLRIVIHRDISIDDINKIIVAFDEISDIIESNYK
jgi:threonine aldolase